MYIYIHTRTNKHIYIYIRQHFTPNSNVNVGNMYKQLVSVFIYAHGNDVSKQCTLSIVLRSFISTPNRSIHTSQKYTHNAHMHKIRTHVKIIYIYRQLGRSNI